MENGGFNVKEYFISEIDIDKLYHLSDIKIQLDSTKRQHLLLTGKNGSGKTSLLLRLVRYLKVLKDGHLIRLTGTWPEWEENAKRKMEHASSENERFKAEQDYRQWSDWIRKYSDGIRVAWNDNDGLESAYQKGEFITAYFPAERKAQFAKPNGVENIKLSEVYDTTENAGNILLKYMVHMKTQQSFARNEGDQEIVERIQQWFDRFEYCAAGFAGRKIEFIWNMIIKIIILKSDRKAGSLLNSVNCQMAIHL